MKTLIEDLKKVINSEIENKDKYMEMLINGFLRERDIKLVGIVIASAEFKNAIKEAVKSGVYEDIATNSVIAALKKHLL